MFISTGFSYDGKHINSVIGGNLQLVYVDSSGIRDQHTGVSRNVEAIEQGKLNKRYKQKFKESQIKFEITISKDDEWTIEQKIEVNKWLFKDNYRDLISDDSDYVYKCVATGAKYYHNSHGMGYITVSFECDSGYPYSPLSVHQYTVSGGNGSFNIDTRCNIDGYDYYPEIEIELLGTSTSFSLVNLSNNNSSISMTGLDLLETVYINEQTGNIISDTNKNRLGNLVDKKFMGLTYGGNLIQVTGDCVVTIRTQYPIMI